MKIIVLQKQKPDGLQAQIFEPEEERKVAAMVMGMTDFRVFMAHEAKVAHSLELIDQEPVLPPCVPKLPDPPKPDPPKPKMTFSCTACGLTGFKSGWDVAKHRKTCVAVKRLGKRDRKKTDYGSVENE